MKNSQITIPELSCTISKKDLARLVTLLQSGFFRSTENPTPFLLFLSSLPGFTRDYILNDIGTIFLNGDAIDDFELPLTGKTATIALSSAMPGLCGSILKKGSPHAALRRTRVVKIEEKSGDTVLVRIRLFNIIALERGPELFAEGVQIRSADLISFLSLRPSLLQTMHDISFAGNTVFGEHLLDTLAPHPDILLKTLCDESL